MKTLHNVVILGLTLCNNVLEVLQDVSVTGTLIPSLGFSPLRETLEVHGFGADSKDVVIRVSMHDLPLFIKICDLI